MKKLLFIPSLLLILFSMSIQAQSKFELNPNGAKDEAVVKSYLEAMLSRDPAKLEKNHSPNYVGYGPRWNSPESKADMIQSVKGIWDNFDNVRYERERRISVTVTGDEEAALNGNWVLSWAIFVGKDKTTGKEVSLDTHQSFKIENGMIVLSTVYYNELDYLMQTGQFTGD